MAEGPPASAKHFLRVDRFAPCFYATTSSLAGCENHALSQQHHARMADTTPQRRVLPARERRESAAKRMAASPPPAPAPSPKKPTPKTGPGSRGPRGPYKKKPRPEADGSPMRQPSSPIVVEEGMPAKISDHRPLPTAKEPQSERLSSHEYQSIADSAVLSASLHRSRAKWLVEGLFDRYWTKPSKKKGAPEIHNPELKTMQRLGTCIVTIEPHTFEATLFTVRESSPSYPPPLQQPTYQSAPAPAYSQHYRGLNPQPAVAAPPMQARPPVTQSPGLPSAPSTAATNAKPIGMTPNAVGSHKSPAFSRSDSDQPKTPVGPKPSLSASAPPVQSSKPNSDPVIQALATRAASDPDLKALMKVVASSEATPDQLRRFQNHIDELNAMLKRKQEKEKVTDAPTETTPSATPRDAKPTSQTIPKTNGTPSQTPMSVHPSPPFGATPANIPPPGIARPSPSPSPYATYPPPPLPRQPSIQPTYYPPPLLRVKHMIIEFTSPLTSSHSPSTDRFLLPEYCVLEFFPPPVLQQGPPLEMLCSFLVIRSGSWILERGGDSSYYKKDEEYFEPVSMMVKVTNPKILETWGKNAKTLREVREWMENVIKTKKRAQTEYLITRLPVEKPVAEANGMTPMVGKRLREDTAGSGHEGSEDDVLLDSYDAPSFMAPMSK